MKILTTTRDHQCNKREPSGRVGKQKKEKKQPAPRSAPSPRGIVMKFDHVCS
jgi:hypothetical protein